MARQSPAVKRISKHKEGKSLPLKTPTSVITGRIEMALNIDRMSLKELQELEARVKKALVVARDREKGELKQQVESMLAEAGLSLSELYGERSAARGKTVAAKYVNPDNRSETWSGRGRRPLWLVAKLDKGASQDEFAI